jgi:hypothetical protein
MSAWPAYDPDSNRVQELGPRIQQKPVGTSLTEFQELMRPIIKEAGR